MKNFQIEFKWGIIFSIFTLFWMYFEKSMGWHTEHISKHQTYTNLLIIPLFFIIIISFALLEKKKKYYKGFITWEQGVISGSIISIIICLLTPMIQAIFINYISPNYYNDAAIQLSERGVISLEKAKEVYNLKASIIDAVVFNLAMGIVTSAIVSIFIKKKPTE